MVGNFYNIINLISQNKTIGLTLRGKAKIFTNPFCGFELAVFTNLNNIQSVIGIEFHVNLGKISE